MGDPKFPRRSYDTPSHPWQGERIKEEHQLCVAYGLKNKRELWKAKSILRNFRKQSRDLQARIRTGEEQAKIERDNLLKRCARMGLLPMDGTTLDDVLGLQAESILNRRLETLVVRKGLAASAKQARQMITHGHVWVDERKLTIPGYIVERGQEEKISYNQRSPFNNELHPLRVDFGKVVEARQRRVAREARKEREEERGGSGSRPRGRGKFQKKAARAVTKVKEVAVDTADVAPLADVDAAMPKEE